MPPEDGATLYAVCDTKSQFNLGRTVTQETLDWWDKQSSEARAVFNDENRVSLSEALFRLRDFCDGWLTDKGAVWVNGASFDLRILSHAYRTSAIPLPWHFRQECCMRALRRLERYQMTHVPGFLKYKEVCAASVNCVAHNALDDAIRQATYVRQWMVPFMRVRKAL